MGRIGLAFKLFFKALGDGDFATRARALFEPGAAPAQPRIAPATPAPPATVVPARSDAISLLAVLQRESRLIDFLKEDISSYADAQIGAAVRDVHRDAAAALERVVGLRPVVEQAEGSEVNLGSPVDANRFRLVGNVGAGSPARGKLQHPGWRATKLELPQYTGAAEGARVVAPAEVEV
jgi:hypothetical protein